MKLIKKDTKTNYTINFSEDEIQFILSSLYCSYLTSSSTDNTKRSWNDIYTELIRMVKQNEN